MDKVSIVERSALTVSKTSKRTYFTVKDDTDRKLICFDPTLYDKLTVGSVVQLDIQPGKSETDTPRIVGIGQMEGNPEAKPEAEAAKSEIPHTISGQEIGRCWNAIDALYIADKLNILFGKENAIAILKYYRGVLTSTLKLPVDGALLPKWDKKE